MKTLFNLILGFLLTLFFGLAVAPFYDSDGKLHQTAIVIAVVVVLYKLFFVRFPKGVLREGLTITDTSYAGSVLEQFISYASTQFDTLRKNCINVLPGIKKKQTVPSLTVDSFIQAHQETPQHGGSIDVGGRVLEPQDFMGYLEFNPRKFEGHWSAVKMNPKLLDAALPKTAESAIVQEVLKANGSYMDRSIWRSEKDDAAIATAIANGLAPGDNNLIFMDGFQRKMFLDADVTKTAASAIAKGNIQSKFEALAGEISSEVYEHPLFKFCLAGAHRQAYTDAQKDQQYKGVDFTKSGAMEFDGKPVVLIHGMSEGTIWAGKAGRNSMESNLWLGVNELDEDSYLKLMQLANNSEKWFIKMLFKQDVNYGLPEEMALHVTETYL